MKGTFYREMFEIETRSISGGNEGAGSGENLSKLAWSHGVLDPLRSTMMICFRSCGPRNRHHVTGLLVVCFGIFMPLWTGSHSCDVVTMRRKEKNGARTERGAHSCDSYKADQTDRTEFDYGVLSKYLTWPSRRLGQRICVRNCSLLTALRLFS